MKDCPDLEALPVLAGHGRLTKLDLSGATDFKGWDALAQLTNLMSLTIAATGATGAFSLVTLTALTNLNIAHTGISSLPGLENLRALQTLEANFSKLHNLTGLSNLASLRFLNVRGTSNSELLAWVDCLISKR